MKPCTVEGCTRPKAPGQGRRLCVECKATAHHRRRTPGRCSIDGCDSPRLARGWCKRHDEHNRQYGTPYSRTLRDRFDEKVDRDGPEFRPLGSCWLWTGTGTRSGYGQLFDAALGRHNYAHRVSYELHVGPIPDGLQIDHLCRRKPCVNPRHLEPVTPAENTRRAFRAIAAEKRNAV